MSIYPFVLTGWEDASTWGDDNGWLYAQLTPNGVSDRNGPKFWITPPHYPVVHTAPELAEVIARTTACAKPAVLHAMATGAAVMRVSDAEWRRLFPELTRADLPASTQEVPTMATRLDRDRRLATASSVWLGDPRPAAPEYGPDSPHPITTRDIHTVGRHIGWLYHRDYDSGYPGRYEVGMLGGRPWSFYDTEDDAVRGAEEYAAAVLRPGPQRLAQGLVDLHRLPTPIDRAVLASTPSLLRPWPTGREGRRQVARELRAAACGHLDPMSYHRVLTAVADYLAGDE